ncbi:hypothetical protein BDV93DRAFT_516549 [Ceratobasidium sp. AG-I]|nr:hypothetical protein BDV93DRAFT_516549 [Ceratobasidium sp. AG-I]
MAGHDRRRSPSDPVFRSCPGNRFAFIVGSALTRHTPGLTRARRLVYANSSSLVFFSWLTALVLSTLVSAQAHQNRLPVVTLRARPSSPGRHPRRVQRHRLASLAVGHCPSLADRRAVGYSQDHPPPAVARSAGTHVPECPCPRQLPPPRVPHASLRAVHARRKPLLAVCSYIHVRVTWRHTEARCRLHNVRSPIDLVRRPSQEHKQKDTHLIQEFQKHPNWVKCLRPDFKLLLSGLKVIAWDHGRKSARWTIVGADRPDASTWVTTDGLTAVRVQPNRRKFNLLRTYLDHHKPTDSLELTAEVTSPSEPTTTAAGTVPGAALFDAPSLNTSLEPLERSKRSRTRTERDEASAQREERSKKRRSSSTCNSATRSRAPSSVGGLDDEANGSTARAQSAETIRSGPPRMSDMQDTNIEARSSHGPTSATNECGPRIAATDTGCNRAAQPDATRPASRSGASRSPSPLPTTHAAPAEESQYTYILESLDSSQLRFHARQLSGQPCTGLSDKALEEVIRVYLEDRTSSMEPPQRKAEVLLSTAVPIEVETHKKKKQVTIDSKRQKTVPSDNDTATESESDPEAEAEIIPDSEDEAFDRFYSNPAAPKPPDPPFLHPRLRKSLGSIQDLTPSSTQINNQLHASPAPRSSSIRTSPSSTRSKVEELRRWSTTSSVSLGAPPHSTSKPQSTANAQAELSALPVPRSPLAPTHASTSKAAPWADSTNKRHAISQSLRVQRTQGALGHSFAYAQGKISPETIRRQQRLPRESPSHTHSQPGSQFIPSLPNKTAHIVRNISKRRRHEFESGALAEQSQPRSAQIETHWLEDDLVPDNEEECQAAISEETGQELHGRKRKPSARDVHGYDKQILTVAKLHLFAVILVEGAYQTRVALMRLAAWVFEETWNQELPDIPYRPPPTSVLQIMVNSMATMRGKIKEIIRPLVEFKYHFTKPATTDSAVNENLRVFQQYAPVYGHYESDILTQIIAAALFSSPSSVGIMFSDYFNPMQLTTVAFILANIQFCIEEWETGNFRPHDLSTTEMLNKYIAHLRGLKEARAAARTRISRLQQDWFNFGREYSGAVVEDTPLYQPITLRDEVRPDTPSVDDDEARDNTPSETDEPEPNPSVGRSKGKGRAF